MERKEKEEILCAAVKLNTGAVIFTPQPRRHSDILLGLTLDERYGSIQGFKTTYGRFVNRAEAYKIAKAANQLINANTSYELYTEDVW